MKLKKPSHATVVAYLALFAALGGTAIAARDNLGAKELKPLVVRKDRFKPSGEGGDAAVLARCQNERAVHFRRRRLEPRRRRATLHSDDQSVVA